MRGHGGIFLFHFFQFNHSSDYKSNLFTLSSSNVLQIFELESQKYLRDKDIRRNRQHHRPAIHNRGQDRCNLC